MSIETTENFWAAFNATEEITKPKLFYRLYHDGDGNPLYYSMEDLPGNYVEVDRETYSHGLSNVKVVDGVLTIISPKMIYTKLMPSEMGIPCAKNNICIVVSEDEPHTKWENKTV